MIEKIQKFLHEHLNKHFWKQSTDKSYYRICKLCNKEEIREYYGWDEQNNLINARAIAKAQILTEGKYKTNIKPLCFIDKSTILPPPAPKPKI